MVEEEDNKPKYAFKDAKNLKPEDSKKLKTCYLEVYTTVDDILRKHYINDPFSPSMLNMIIGPMYSTILHTMTKNYESPTAIYKTHEEAVMDMMMMLTNLLLKPHKEIKNDNFDELK